ncbi:unnamed protein product [Schistosoma turkestanicum]|nr:unnamed protein product [Schistosoma turkestanicum]
MPSRDYKDDCIILDDSFEGQSAKNFVLPSDYAKYIESILVPNGMILDRISKMARDILNEYERSGTDTVHIICILKGGYQFAYDLFKCLHKYSVTRNKYVRICIDFISASTYVNDSVGHDTKINPCTNMEKFKDKHVLIAEDLVDTGTSLNNLEKYIRKYEPKSICSTWYVLIIIYFRQNSHESILREFHEHGEMKVKCLKKKKKIHLIFSLYRN